MTAYEILKQYFGYDKFRSGQAELISHILQGQDVFGIMPTGAGKSLFSLDFADAGSGSSSADKRDSGRLSEQYAE